MMIHCAYPKTLELSESNLNKLKDYYIFHPYESNDTLYQATEVLIGSPPKNLIESLKWIQMIPAGFDSIDLTLLKENNIILTNGSGTTNIAIAEYAVGALLYSIKDFKQYTKFHENAEWKPLDSGKELSGSKIAILGTGHIGSEITRRLNAFNVDIIGFNSKGSEAAHFDKTLPLDDFENHIETFDCVILALPLNDKTKHFFNLDRLSKLKKSTILINVGRGAVIELDALESVIDNHLGFVFLDVVEDEPLPKSSKLWRHDKVIITPHISYLSQYRSKNLEALIVDNLIRYATNIKLKNIVSL